MSEKNNHKMFLKELEKCRIKTIKNLLIKKRKFKQKIKNFAKRKKS